MKYIFIFLSLIVAKHCHHKSTQPPVAFKVTYQGWSGGAAGSGHGIYYNVYIQMQKGADIIFDSLWANNLRVPLQPFTQNYSDTLQLVGQVFYPGEHNQDLELSYQSDVSKPLQTDAEAVVGYFINGQRAYLLIDKLTVLKYLAYP